MTIKTLTSDPAVALELGRRMAANAKRQPRHPNRMGAVWNRLFAAPGAAAKPHRTHV